MKPKPEPFIRPGDWLLAMLGYALFQCCIAPMFSRATFEPENWHPFATPTAMPVPVPLNITPDDEAAAREAYCAWLCEQHGLQALPDPELEDRATYLAGEAPHLLLYG